MMMEHLNSYNEHFTIGKKVKAKKNPTNVYKLVINNMSGDADGYEKTKTLFKKEEEGLVKDLVDLCKWAVKDWPSRDSIEFRYNEIMKKHNRYSDDDWDIITYDNFGDCMCRPYFTSLTWFDENGDEFEVDIK